MSSMTGKSKLPKGYKEGSINNFTPEQMKLFQRMFSTVGPQSFMGKLASGDQSQFQQMEAPALQQFNQIQEGIANKYSGTAKGQMSGRNSSNFYNAQNAAGMDFAQRLQAERLKLQYGATQDLFNMQNTLLGQRPQDKFMIQKEKKKSFWDSVLPGIATAGGAIIGGLAGGPGGAVMGSQIGSAFGGGYGYGYNS